MRNAFFVTLALLLALDCYLRFDHEQLIAGQPELSANQSYGDDYSFDGDVYSYDTGDVK